MNANENKKLNEKGSIDFAFGGILRCLICPKENHSNDSLLMQISMQIEMLNKKIDQIERYFYCSVIPL